MTNRRFFVIVAVLLGAMAWMMVVSVEAESQTWDEAMHLAAGYSYWKTGDYRLNPEHPPLGKLLNAIPLLFLDVPLPVQHPSWIDNDEFRFGQQFLYNGPYSAGDLLFRARMVTVAITLLLGLCLALWTRSYFSSEIALAALGFYCFDPTVIAHGRYITSDLLIAFTSFLAAIAWLWWIEKPGAKRLLVVGIALGLAMASKYSWPFLLPVFVLIGLLRKVPVKRLVLSMVVQLLVGGMVVALVYAPQISKLIPATQGYRKAHPDTVLLSKALEGTYESKTMLGRAATAVSGRLGIQAHPYLLGIVKHAGHVQLGHPAYLLGKVSDFGWWYYFPVAFFVKEPIGLLLAVAFCLAALFGDRVKFAAALQLPGMVMVIYWAMAMAANINIGYRHLLPVLPFLFVIVAVLLHGRWPSILAACLLLQAGETVWRHPYPLAFFNVLAGGPEKGGNYLADSNIDWGQDLKRLRAWKETYAAKDNLCIAYFGGAPLEYFGMTGRAVPHSDDVAGRDTMDCFAAVSVTLLVGAYEGREAYAWLRGREPLVRIGYSIYVYDLRGLKR